MTPPEELSRPILRIAVRAIQQPPAGPIRPNIDGEVTSYFEWLGAGFYRVDERSGSMHGKKFLVREVQYGATGRACICGWISRRARSRRSRIWRRG